MGSVTAPSLHTCEPALSYVNSPLSLFGVRAWKKTRRVFLTVSSKLKWTYLVLYLIAGNWTKFKCTESRQNTLDQNNFREKSRDFCCFPPLLYKNAPDQEEHRVNLSFPFRGGQRSTPTLPLTTAAAAVAAAGWLMLPWAHLVFRAFTNKCRRPHILPCRPPGMLLVFPSCWRHLAPI